MQIEHAGGDWTDPEIKRFLSRSAKLMLHDMSDAEAEKLAERLVYRDRPDSGDDRKLCLECLNWRGKCLKQRLGYCSVPTILQLCDGFKAVA